MTSPFVRGPETDALVAALRRMAPGDTVSFSELSAQVGFDVTIYRGNLDRARDVVRREAGAVIDLADQAVYRLTDSEVVRLDRYLSKARNASRRATEALEGVDYAALPEGERTARDAKLTVGRMALMLFRPKSRREIERAVKVANAVLPPAEAIKLFAKVQ